MIEIQQPIPKGYLGARKVFHMKLVIAPQKVARFSVKQKAFLRYLSKFQSKNGWMPSTIEMCRDMGWSSWNSATEYLAILERKGAIVRGEHGASRCIRIVIDQKEFA